MEQDLFQAVLDNDPEYLAVCLQNGSEIDAKNRMGLTALMMASHFGKDGIVDVLLERGANTNITGNDGWTALLLAARQGHSGIVKQLLRFDADPQAQDKAFGRTPLMWAEHGKHQEIINFLKQPNATPILMIEDSPFYANTVLNMAKDSSLTITVAGSLAEGLKQLDDGNYSALLLDLNLPDSAGMQTVERVLIHTRKIPIIVLTSTDDHELVKQSLQQGAQDYLVKQQVTINLLQRTIFHASERHHLLEELERFSEDLEHKVELRTEELQSANQHLQEEINARKEVEAKLKEYSAKLEMSHQELEQKHSLLKDAQAKLVQSEKMSSMGTLVAGVAHEINNPINFVYVEANNLSEDLKRLESFIFDLADEDADDELFRAFEEKFKNLFQEKDAIVDGAERIKTIVKDLRTFSRLDEAELKFASVLEGLKSTLNLVRSSYQQEVQFECDFQADPKLECRPAQLNQVFMNMLVNASQAICERQKKEPGCPNKLTILVFQEEEHLVVVFKDTGSGMPKTVQQKIFEPFFTTKEVGQGTGLGLSISFGIIQEHQGTIHVESEEGQGTKFTIRLPLELTDTPETE